MDYLIELQKYNRKKAIAHGIEQIAQRSNQDQLPSTLKERGQIRFEDQYIKSQSNGGDIFLEDEQFYNDQKLNLKKGLSNESPVYQKNVEFYELSDFPQKKQNSTRDNFQNSNINNNQYHMINSIAQQQGTSSMHLSNFPFVGPQSSQQQQQLQLQPIIGSNNSNLGLIGILQQKNKNAQTNTNPLIQTIQQSSNKSLVPTHSIIAKSQKYHNLKYKMNERVHNVQKDSVSSVPLETQVPLEMFKNVQDTSNNSQILQIHTSDIHVEGGLESMNQTSNFITNSSPSQRINIQLQQTNQNDIGESYSPRQYHYQNARNPDRNNNMQGFSNAIEDSIAQGIGNSPRNHASSSVYSRNDGNREDSSLVMQEQSKQAEEYKKKYDLAAASAAANSNSNSNTPQAPNNLHLMLHQQVSSKQNNLRIEHLKKQVRDSLQSQQQNHSNVIDQSQSQSESPRSAGLNSQNNSFASSQQSSATSPTNIVGPYSLQRMPSLLSNKSSKSKFSRYAPNNTEELNESIQSPSQVNLPQNKKSSQFARLNSRFDNSDGQEDQSQKSPPKLDFEREQLEYFPPITKDDGFMISQYKSVFMDQFNTAKSEKLNILGKKQEVINDKQYEGDQLTEEEEEVEGQEQSSKNRVQYDQNSGDPYIFLPEMYKYQTFNKNPFMPTDLLLKTVVKRDQLFFFVQIFFSFESMLEQVLFYDQALSHSFFILKADSMVYKSGWDCEIIINFQQFIENLVKPYTEFSFFKFLYSKGFSLKQKIAIKKGIEKYLQVKDCQFIFNWEAQRDSLYQQQNAIANTSYIDNAPLTNPINRISPDDYILDENSEDDSQSHSSNENEEDTVPDLNAYKNYAKILQQGTINSQITYKQNKQQKKDVQRSKKKKLTFSQHISTDYQQLKGNSVNDQLVNQESDVVHQTASFSELSLIINPTKRKANYQSKVSFNQQIIGNQEFGPVKVNKDRLYSDYKAKLGEKKTKLATPKLLTIVNDTTIVEFKSNLDVKILAQQGLKKLNNYETPAREEDYTETSNLLSRNDLVVLLKYIEGETKSFHKILIYKPLSKTPLCSCEITDMNILERFLNLKWLDIQIITLLKKQSQQQRRNLIQPHINQGLTSIDNLKKIIFNSFFQVRNQMNGQVINLRPVFYVENQRIRHNLFIGRNERLKKISNFLLENIQKAKEMSFDEGMENMEGVNQVNKPIRDFLQQMKYAIVSYDISDEWQFQQNEIVNKYFEKKSIKDYGYINSHSKQTKFKVFMILTIFRTQVHLNLQKIVYLRLDIAPLAGQRNKQFKMIFELSDIVNLFERTFSFEKSFEDLILFRIIQKISKCLIYSKNQVYKGFSLPLSKINPQQVDRHQFSLINRFSIKPPGHLIPKEISKRSFFDIVQQGERVLYQGVKRLLNTYAIITIGYYSQLDYYYLQIYLPYNCRRFTNTFYTSNLANLSGEYMNSIFKEKIVKHNLDELNKSKDYSQFYKKLVKLDPSKQHANRQQATQKTQGISNWNLKSSNKIVQNTIEESVESSFEQKPISTHCYVNPNLFLDMIKPNIQQNMNNTHNFTELNIWEEIANSAEICIDSNGEMLLTMDNYSGIMREYLIKSIVNFSGNKNGLFEVLIRFKDQKLKQDLYNSPQIQIHDSDEIKLDMYVRINFFQKVNQINEKILLRQILFSYYNHNRLKFRNIPKEQHLSHHYMNLLNPNTSEGQQFSQGDNQNGGGSQYFHNQYHNAQRFNAEQDYISPSPHQNNNNNNNVNNDDLNSYLNFSECTFDHSDLINVSQLLLDRIRTSIQEKQTQIMKFYDHQNEVFETGRSEQNYEVNEPTPLPPVQLQITQNVASAYLNLNELLQEPTSILKKNLISSSKPISKGETNTEIWDASSFQQMSAKKNQSSHTLDQTMIDQKTELNYVSQLVGVPVISEIQINKPRECMVDRKARKKIKMNNNININELLDSENKQLYMKTLYRGIFTVRPLQIIAIFFYKKFYVQIYNTINGKNLITDLSFSTVEHQIPYLKHMLKLELYQEIGYRIFLSFKNRLMIKSYPELIDY